MPSQWAWNELRISPWNKNEIECPSPQPGHQLKPISFKGHKVKCVWLAGLVKARQVSPATQNASSKYW